MLCHGVVAMRGFMVNRVHGRSQTEYTPHSLPPSPLRMVIPLIPCTPHSLPPSPLRMVIPLIPCTPHSLPPSPLRMVILLIPCTNRVNLAPYFLHTTDDMSKCRGRAIKRVVVCVSSLYHRFRIPKRRLNHSRQEFRNIIEPEYGSC